MGISADIARAHDRQSDLEPSLENLARRQRVPSALLLRVMDALQASGLVQLSADDPSHYLPGFALDRLRLAEILHSVRRAGSVDSDSDRLPGDPGVVELLDGIESSLDTFLGETTLADLIHQNDKSKNRDEDSLV